jgi:hypothetical protein
MADFARDREASVPPEVAAAWAKVDAAWSDAAAHDRFVELVAATTSYPWAAQRYREALRLRPDDPVAGEQLARLAKMAEATLFAGAARRPSKAPMPYRGALVLLAALIFLILLGLGYAVLTTHTR